MHRFGRDRFRRKDFVITPLNLSVPGLGENFDGYRIVQISDLHMGHWLSPERLHGVVKIINQQEPDLIALTGDYVSYVMDQIADELTQGLINLKPRDASVAVLGNHDHWMNPLKLRKIFKHSGVIELANDIYTVQRGQQNLHIAGVDDIMVNKDRLDLVLEKLPPDDPAILLAHEPDFADISAATGRFFLQLSGHSHGGQIVWPGLGPLFRGPMFRKYPLGVYRVGNMVQYTNRGIGTHVFRIRINCPPEITLITLRSTSL